VPRPGTRWREFGSTSIAPPCPRSRPRPAQSARQPRFRTRQFAGRAPRLAAMTLDSAGRGSLPGPDRRAVRAWFLLRMDVLRHPPRVSNSCASARDAMEPGAKVGAFQHYRSTTRLSRPAVIRNLRRQAPQFLAPVDNRHSTVECTMRPEGIAMGDTADPSFNESNVGACKLPSPKPANRALNLGSRLV